ncbi:MAG: peptidoglycan DD-metalloendopeptidase family protein [Deferribacteraceae bacterium]|jgi:murein DD-endopeptidase MepM/ murein hydrolase activator NlpD|nr:peptidoglycan DD-metalloendopeptidase family protein [Deferribacteraceae bacterium]
MKLVSIVFLVAALALPTFAGYTVQQGDTLSAILAAEYSHEEIVALSQELKAEVPSFVLRTGMNIEQDGTEYTFRLAVDKDARIYREDGLAKLSVLSYEREVMPTIVSGTITSSLFAAVAEIGEDIELAANIARMYEWEFDFFKDIRVGDSFTVLLEKIFINGRYVGYGQILAADFVVQGRSHKAYLYTDGKTAGYYDEKGAALERGFLRVPLSYSRISSRFSSSRRHPVFGNYRPHYGVDYAAPRGTPVMSTAAGTIEARAYAKGNGNYVRIRHANGYTTYYLHLNGFASGQRVGTPVKQGEVIGYVGSTGYSTGNHLDYRINHRGKWLNPINFIAESPKLEKEHVESFMAVAAARQQTLKQSYMYAGMWKPTLIP